MRPSLRRMRDRIDPETYGGAVLLGVRGLAVIGHGNSTGRGHRERRARGARGARASASWSSSAPALAGEGAERSPTT